MDFNWFPPLLSRTVRDGDWSDPSTWLGGVYPSTASQGTLLPQPPNWFTAGTGDRIIIRHQVTLDYTVLIMGTDVLLIDTTGVILANDPFRLLNLSPGQTTFPAGGPAAGLIVRGAIESEYLRNTGLMWVGPTATIKVFGNFDQFAQTLNLGDFQVIDGELWNRMGTLDNRGSLVVNRGRFLNQTTLITSNTSCISVYGSFLNDSLASVTGPGFAWVQDSLDNSTNQLSAWSSAEWCAGIALNMPVNLENCSNTNCAGVNPVSCNAAFAVSTIGTNYVFDNYSGGSIGGLSWDFGDGNTSQLTTPFHSYSSPGTYTVCLSVLDSLLGFCDSTCRTVNFVHGPCSANFQYTQNGNQIVFANASSGNIGSYIWDFGDGGASALPHPTHVYALPDTYQVCMTLLDPGGGVCDSLCRPVIVAPDSCTADFSQNVVLDSVDFTFTGSGTYTNIDWDFGDGQTATSVLNPTHGYAVPGTYSVCITLYETFGTVCDSICKTVTVPAGNCTADFSFVQVDSMLTFTDLSSGDQTLTVWDFGDGVRDSSANPVHVYDSTGFFLVCLELWDVFGLLCDSTCEVVNIGVVSRDVWLEAEGRIAVYPNPFEESVRIEAEGIDMEGCRIEILDLHGSLVRDWRFKSGANGGNGIGNGTTEWVWDGRNQENELVQSGVYILRFRNLKNGIEFRRRLVKVW